MQSPASRKAFLTSVRARSRGPKFCKICRSRRERRLRGRSLRTAPAGCRRDSTYGLGALRAPIGAEMVRWQVSHLVDDARFGWRNRPVFDDSTAKILGGGQSDVIGEIGVSGGPTFIQALLGLHHARDYPMRTRRTRASVAAIIGHPVGVDLYNHSVHRQKMSTAASL